MQTVFLVARVALTAISAAIVYFAMARLPVSGGSSHPPPNEERLERADPRAIAEAFHGELTSGKLISAPKLEFFLESMSRSNLETALRGLGAAFWAHHPNGVPLLSRAMDRIASENGALYAMAETIDLLQISGIDEMTMGRYLEVGFLAATENEPLTPEEIGVLLTKLAPAEALSCLQAYAVRMEFREPAALLGMLRSAWSASGKALDANVEARIIYVAARAMAIGGKSQEAVQLLGEIKDGNERSRLQTELCRFLQGSGGSGFQDFFLELAKRDTKAAATICFGSEIPTEALPALVGTLPERSRELFLRDYFLSLRERNPSDVAEVARVFPASSLPKESAAILCANLGAAAHGALHEWLSSLPEGKRAQLLDNAFSGYFFESALQSDPNAKMAWLIARSAFPGGSEDVRLALAGLSPEQRESLLPYATKFSSPLRETLLADIYRFDGSAIDQMVKDPAAAMARIESAPESVRDAVRRNGVRSLLAFDLRKAFEFNNSLQVPVEKGELLKWAMEEREGDSRIQMELFTRYWPSLENTQDKAACAGALLERLGERDPAAGLAVLAKLDDSNIHEIGLTKFARAWTESDPFGASEWIARMPAGRARDLATLELTPNSVDDPEVALINAKAIQDPQLRIEAASTIFKAWQNISPDVVLKFAHTAGFMSSDITQIQQIIADDRPRQ